MRIENTESGGERSIGFLELGQRPFNNLLIMQMFERYVSAYARTFKSSTCWSAGTFREDARGTQRAIRRRDQQIVMGSLHRVPFKRGSLDRKRHITQDCGESSASGHHAFNPGTYSGLSLALALASPPGLTRWSIRSFGSAQFTAAGAHATNPMRRFVDRRIKPGRCREHTYIGAKTAIRSGRSAPPIWLNGPRSNCRRRGRRPSKER